MAEIYFPYFSSPKPSIKIIAEDNLLRSPTEAGYVLLRPRYSRVRKTYEIKWDFNKDEVFEFVEFYDNTTDSGSSAFWIDITIDTTRINKKVYFAKVPDVVYNGIGAWEVSCSFTEV